MIQRSKRLLHWYLFDFFKKNHKYYYFIDYTEKTSILALFYTFVESFILTIFLIICRVMNTHLHL